MSASNPDEQLITRRTYLTMKACEWGANLWEGIEAVASTAIAHPEWDMEERRTRSDWEARS